MPRLNNSPLCFYPHVLYSLTDSFVFRLVLQLGIVNNPQMNMGMQGAFQDPDVKAFGEVYRSELLN